MKNADQLRRAIRKAAGESAVLNDYQVDNLIDLLYKIIRTDLMGLTEVAERLNIELSTANMRAHRAAHPERYPTSRDPFPPPVTRINGRRVWTRWEVEGYIRDNPKAVRHNVHQEAS